jgi:site-specific DNA-adenine methylase
MRNYNQAPLPFQGQKRRFLKLFKERLKQFNPTATYVDLFGGSGLLSHTVKQTHPSAKVIYNDFDNYHLRLKNIDKTNALLSDMAPCLNKFAKGQKVSEDVKIKVLDRIAQEDGFVDYITVSSNLIHSAQRALNFTELNAQTFYGRGTVKTNYTAEGYLDGVDIVSHDYKTLYRQYQGQELVFLLDPPYLSTDVSSYTANTWGLKDYLEMY